MPVWIAVVLWLFFVASSCLSAITLWMSSSKLRLGGAGILILLAPTFFGVYFYKNGMVAWLALTSVLGIGLQLLLFKVLAENES